eukprot:CAMPEP_0185033378 /NCGR_PEP_ID=MMETSP1103-20130426/22248_1 /TAXON_ID=36769 /ORGANISM="Paraphysomonas bandaiensis, Strain Caron Lab Isolate" /LENGTH=306 /DNA_ID=CAMNT_0027569617 /DNA_START=23 /DNA_END=943 /DNA_ORIENTATION=+
MSESRASHKKRKRSHKASSESPSESVPCPGPCLHRDGVRGMSGEQTHNKFSKMKWDFEVDYNDHFETPLQAYVDLLPALAEAAKDIDKPLHELIIYDPYYCDGKMMEMLTDMGFRNVVNKNRDFYVDIESNNIPEYDILVTNPPYSGEHKSKLLQYLSGITKPFALLLPAYTATKSYWKEFVQSENTRCKNHTGCSTSLASSVLYVLPPGSYAYSHPEGTGKGVPPFYSAWFIGGGFSSMQSVRMAYTRSSTQAFPGLREHQPSDCLTVLSSVEALIKRGYVTDSSKRANPKVRKKQNQRKESNRN